jgi:dynamin GTPase
MKHLIVQFFLFHAVFGSAVSAAKIEELLQEDQNVKRRRERAQKQSSLLSKLTRQLSVHDNRAAAASNWSDRGSAAGTIYKFS